MNQITPKHPSATQRIRQALAAGAHQICAEDVAEMLNEAPTASELLAALEIMRAKAEDTFALWEGDKNIRVGKMLKALAGHLPKYDPSIDRAHAARLAAKDRHADTMPTTHY